MDTRYEHPGLALLWAPDTTLLYWHTVECVVALAQGRSGRIPADSAQAIAQSPPPTPDEVAAEEERTRHDLAAFVHCMARNVPEPHRRWVHYGLTSSDVVDTANAIRAKRATEVIRRETDALLDALQNMGERYRHALRIGRTHGQHAEPTSFGHQCLALRSRVLRAQWHLTNLPLPMKLSGPVGTGAYNPPPIQRSVAHELGLTLDPHSTQVVARDYYTTWAHGLVLLACACEAIATEIRIGAQTEIDELVEPFLPGQVGSSAMPHKRNPVRSERLVGLARVARGLFLPVLETTGALWGERDISNSSVERSALRDLTVLVGWMVAETVDLVQNLVVDVDQMEATVREQRLPSSAARLWLAVRHGVDREEAYRDIQSPGAGTDAPRDPSTWDDWDAASDPLWYLRNLNL